MASKNSKSSGKKAPALVGRRGAPWATIAAVTVVVVFAAAVLGYALFQNQAKSEKETALEKFTPSATLQDPSKNIAGVIAREFEAGKHVAPNERVAYTQFPPFGGAHDYNWAACTGVVYPTAVRNENMVHSLEHGAVWIAYDPARISGAALDSLKQRAEGKQYTMLSPYPGLDAPVSLQSWGHQLKVADAADPRIDEFIQALRQNKYAYPEVGASCDALGPGMFDQDNPPAFETTPAGPGAHKEDGSDIVTPAGPTG
ncbi:DUF3105 domain-containing protein [Pseudonocardia spinosispora]|uniref:DUF3105 domain-containing protein n=1 Tax=Pseudonocardia spinosispora TaxID=103441 RepID=UPI0004244C81|nr:DUF3105 domain-containing protein [Pseudonocardia spinosispora]